MRSFEQATAPMHQDLKKLETTLHKSIDTWTTELKSQLRSFEIDIKGEISQSLNLTCDLRGK